MGKKGDRLSIDHQRSQLLRSLLIFSSNRFARLSCKQRHDSTLQQRPDSRSHVVHERVAVWHFGFRLFDVCNFSLFSFANLTNRDARYEWPSCRASTMFLVVDGQNRSARSAIENFESASIYRRSRSQVILPELRRLPINFALTTDRRISRKFAWCSSWTHEFQRKSPCRIRGRTIESIRVIGSRKRARLSSVLFSNFFWKARRYARLFGQLILRRVFFSVSPSSFRFVSLTSETASFQQSYFVFRSLRFNSIVLLRVPRWVL